MILLIVAAATVVAAIGNDVALALAAALAFFLLRQLFELLLHLFNRCHERLLLAPAALARLVAAAAAAAATAVQWLAIALLVILETFGRAVVLPWATVGFAQPASFVLALLELFLRLLAVVTAGRLAAIAAIALGLLLGSTLPDLSLFVRFVRLKFLQ